MGKKYEKESDFKLINFKLKSRIRELLENKIGSQAIMLLATEISDVPFEIKTEMIDYIDFLIKKLDINIGGTYSSKNLQKAQEASNQFYLAQMKKLILEDKKKQKEGFFKEKTYLSSNAIFVEDVEAQIGEKTVELEALANGTEINARYIIEANDNESLKKVAYSSRIRNGSSSTNKPQSESVISENSKMEQMLKAKEEQERKEMEELRKQLAEQRKAEESSLDKKKNNQEIEKEVTRERTKIIRPVSQITQRQKTRQEIEQEFYKNEKKRIIEAEKLRRELNRQRQEEERKANDEKIKAEKEKEIQRFEREKAKRLAEEKARQNEELVKRQQEKIDNQRKELEIKYAENKDKYRREGISIADFLKKYTFKEHDKIPRFNDNGLDSYSLCYTKYSANEVLLPTNKMYNFWQKFKSKYKIGNLLYWLNNIDLDTQAKVQRKRDKYESMVDKNHTGSYRSSTYTPQNNNSNKKKK